MRRTLKYTLVTSLAVFAVVSQGASAADFGGTALRGSIQPQQQQSTAQLWDGFYAGGLGGYAGDNVSSSKAAQNLVANNLYGTDYQNNKSGLASSTYIQVPKTVSQTATFGGFIGYNSTWEDTVVGVEADYQRYNLKNNSYFDTGGHFFDTGRTQKFDDNGNILTTAVPTYGNFRHTGLDSTKITDVVTLKGRIGYAMGNFLPFITAGFAVGHGERSTQVNVQTYYSATPGTYPATQNTPATTATLTNPTGTAVSKSNKNLFTGGVALGAGFDYAITPNLFLRADYQYIKFASFGSANVAINNVRGGVAAKF